MPNEELAREYRKLLFGVRRSAWYHERRMGFFEAVHRLVLLAALLLGSVSIAAFTTEFASSWPEWIKLAPAALVSVFTGVDLVFAVVYKARLHDGLRVQFIMLERQMKLNQSKYEEKDVNVWSAERLSIEGQEPKVLRVLDVMCHNDMLRSMGHPKKNWVPLKRQQRWCAHFFDLGADDLSIPE